LIQQQSANIVDEDDIEDLKNLMKADDNKVNNEEDDFLVPKKRGESIDPSKLKIELKVSKNQLKKIPNEGGLFNGRNKIHFDKEGNEFTHEEWSRKKIKTENTKALSHEPVYDLIKRKELNTETDKERERDRVREKKLKKKLKFKQNKDQEHEETSGPTLTVSDDQEDEEDFENESDN